jgi:hypothetical protein
MPRWCLGWDVFCWLGHRRFARHWSVPQLRLELPDTHRIRLSEDAIETSIGRYQTMLAARQQDPARLAEAYRDIESLVLTIDGWQPAKGHETLYVVRELTQKRGWFAEPLLSSATEEVRRLIIVARQWSESLAKPVRVWMSDKQEAFVTAIAGEFPGTPHRYCHNHFLRDVAQPGLDMDSRAKVKMRRKVRGWRAIERRVLAERRQAAAPALTSADERPKTVEPPRALRDLGWPSMERPLEATGRATTGETRGVDEVGEVVLEYGAAGRGILNDSQGGPLHPPGGRMREALQDVRDSLERNRQAHKGGLPRHC